MADEAQIIYEYTNGSDVSIKSDDLKIEPKRLFISTSARPDGKIYVHDPNVVQRIFTGTGIIAGADAKELHDVMVAAITYDGTYPRIQKIYWTGALTSTNIPVTGEIVFGDEGSGFWNVTFTFKEYTDA